MTRSKRTDDEKLTDLMCELFLQKKINLVGVQYLPLMSGGGVNRKGSGELGGGTHHRSEVFVVFEMLKFGGNTLASVGDIE